MHIFPLYPSHHICTVSAHSYHHACLLPLDPPDPTSAPLPFTPYPGVDTLSSPVAATRHTTAKRPAEPHAAEAAAVETTAAPEPAAVGSPGDARSPSPGVASDASASPSPSPSPVPAKKVRVAVAAFGGCWSGVGLKREGERRREKDWEYLFLLCRHVGMRKIRERCSGRKIRNRKVKEQQQ